MGRKNVAGPTGGCGPATEGRDLSAEDKIGREAERGKAAEGPVDPLRRMVRELPAVAAPWAPVEMGICLTAFSVPNQDAFDPDFPGRTAAVTRAGATVARAPARGL